MAAAWLCAGAVAIAHAFGFDEVAREADRLARAPYRAPPPPADPALAGLGYDEVRQMRFRPEHATWRGGGTPFELQYFALGGGITRALAMFEIVDGSVRPLNLPPGAFEKGGRGVAGWRLNRWIEQPRRSDELAAFLGASYFRLVAPGLRYGVSARGLAVDTVGGQGEEFPAFTTFWMQRPGPGDNEVRFYALLESPRVTGAYGFVLRPGPAGQAPATVVDVRARLTLRAGVAHLGIAPLTSMFLAGEIQPTMDDYRPEVHDSDGLQLWTGDGEWIWRPLTNPPGVFVTSFATRTPRGFGLMQRDRAFTSYEDLEARYELRPSAWVEPLGDWGAGRVELLQFRTPDETHDNIGAWWSPDRLPAPGAAVEFAWRLTVSDRQPLPPGAWVTQSRRGHGYRGAAVASNQAQFHIDFDGPALQGLVEGEVQAVTSAGDNVRGLRAIAQPHAAASGWRVTLDLERVDAKRPVELRLFLKSTPRAVPARPAPGVGSSGPAEPEPPMSGARTLSETWSHAWAPD